MSATAEKQIVNRNAVAPFGVEINTPGNADVMLQAIPGCRLRGRINPTKVVATKSGEPKTVSEDFVEVPGMQIHVNPAKGVYTITDPLYGNEALCEKVRRKLAERNQTRSTTKVQGVKPLNGTLDEHRMKTLCRELIWLFDAEHVNVVVGEIPALSDVDMLPGKYLLNPGAQVFNSQPRFECEWDSWLAQLTRSGG